MTARKPDAPIVWLDVETTGLDVDRDHLLEVAWILPDGTERTYCVAADDRRGARVGLDIATMHAKSGLLADLDSGANAARLGAIGVAFCADASALGGRVSLGGFSPHFDLGWMRGHVPGAAERLSHRVVDVSTLLRFLRECGAVLPEESTPAHRALADARHARFTWQAWLAESRIVTGTP